MLACLHCWPKPRITSNVDCSICVPVPQRTSTLCGGTQSCTVATGAMISVTSLCTAKYCYVNNCNDAWLQCIAIWHCIALIGPLSMRKTDCPNCRRHAAGDLICHKSTFFWARSNDCIVTVEQLRLQSKLSPYSCREIGADQMLQSKSSRVVLQTDSSRVNVAEQQ